MLTKIFPGKKLTPSSKFLITEALKQGYEVIPQEEFAEFKKTAYRIVHPKTRQEMLVLSNNRYRDLSHHAKVITKHKYLAHQLLQKNNIPTPKTHCFHSLEELLELWEKEYDRKKVVIKPENKGLGKDVFIESKAEKILEAGEKILRTYKKRGLIQEYREGKDLRLQVIGGQLFAACSRVPAHVIGNGTNTITELIRKKNQEKAKISEKLMIRIDEKTQRLLSEQGYDLESIPGTGEDAQLKKVSTVGLGGDPIDVTENVHTDYHELARKLAKLLSVDHFAIDLIVHDEKLAMESDKSTVIEINAPCMWYIHHFAENKKRNVALAILDAHFQPEGFNPSEGKYIIV